MTQPTAKTDLENRLHTQTSPYLLQHRHNPVPWQPWDQRALELARELGRPILLSVGYATCYWCHVMERESFEDPDTGDLLARTVVPIKLDREERPDLDDIYMTATQLLTRHGGWPNNVWLTPPGARGPDDPGLEPFYAGTYFPPKPAHGRPSLTQAVEGLDRAWRDKREEVLAQAENLTNAIRAHLEQPPEPARLDETTVGAAVDVLLRTHDTTNGGFGGAPKFPTPTNLELLLDAGPWIEEDDHKQNAAEALRRTLDAMALGGIRDHLAGGFHRYSVDERWAVPHFEKMLYDNGRLATLYARSYRVGRDPFDLAMAQDTCDWALGEMRDADGLFFSAIDAEVRGREGLNYLWRPDDLDALDLSDADKSFAAKVFGLDGEPNFRDPHHPEDEPAFVLRLADRPERIAAQMRLERDGFDAALARVRAAMLDARGEREQPSTDDKVITAWNGLMIEGLATTASAAPEDGRSEGYLDAAERAAEALWVRMRGGDGVLARTARGGERSQTGGFFEDYALFFAGLLAVSHGCGVFNRDGGAHLDRARQLVDEAIDRFGAGPNSAAMFDAARGEGGLLARARSVHDGAMPSAIGVWINGLHDLHQMTGERRHHEMAVAALGSVSRSVRDSPSGCNGSVRGLLRLLRVDGSLPEKLGKVEESAESPVLVRAAAREVALAAGGEARVPIRLEIGGGHHVNAVDPGPAGAELELEGLSVRVEGSGVVSARLEMPGGEVYGGGALGGGSEGPELLVYSGVVEGAVVLGRVEGPIGSPEVVMRYQVCSDEACYRPIEVALDLRILDGVSGRGGGRGVSE